MFNLKKAAVLGVCGAFLFSLAAGQVKWTTFTAVGEAGSGVDGVGKLKISDAGTANIHLNVSGLAANTTYSVFISGGDLELTFGGVLTTNQQGHANWHGEAFIGPTPVTGAETITIFSDANSDNFVDEGEAVAVGSA